MSYTFWENLAETPWWFYLILFFIFRLAYLATKPRSFFIKPLFISQAMYIIFILLSFISIIQLSSANILLFFTLLSVGTLLGWVQFRYKQIKVIKDKSQVYIPGTWIFFISLFILIPAKYYYFGSQTTFDITVFQQAQWLPFMYGFFGFSMGITLGRTVYLLQAVKQALN